MTVGFGRHIIQKSYERKAKNMKKNTYKRRNYLINKKLQLKYATMLMVTLSLISLFVGMVLYVGIWKFVAKEFSEIIVAQKISTAQRIISYESARYGKPQASVDEPGRVLEEAKRLSEHEKDSIKMILKRVGVRLIPRLMVIVLCIGAASIFLSHRIAGPLYRFKKNIKEISDGNLGVRFELRKKDELHELANELSVMTNRFSDIIIKLKNLSEDLNRQTQELSSSIKGIPSPDNKTPEDLSNKIIAISKEIENLSNTLTIKKDNA